MYGEFVALFRDGIIQPEALWKKKLEGTFTHQSLLKVYVLPVIAIVAVLAGILHLIFGVTIPGIGTIRPSITDALFQMAGTIIIYIATLYLSAWIFAYLAKVFDGNRDFNRAFLMLFLVSIPSMAGQVLSAIPYIGWLLGIALGIYSLVLFYRAIPVFLEVPISKRVVYFITSVVAVIIVSIVFNLTIGRMFMPSQDVVERSANPILSGTGIEDASALIEKADKDRFTPPKNGLLTEKQVEMFAKFSQKVQMLQKEQNEKLKQKYERKEKEQDYSFSDIMNSIRDVSSVATLEIKIVKSNGGNWAEYQWVKEQVREAYYTPSLSDVTQHNAELIEPYKEIIGSVL